ncbi:electron transfer flavoprotein subunit beta/FixA family protein (plasmid) [Fusobacteria bacterium ZRK30]|nr:electron transfer flavoprotein subunit beta/FixA family protein [Fusobacteria bacterium ZRK30]
MKIIVLVKEVPDSNEIRIDPIKGTMIRDGVPSIINPDDKAAIEQALVLKDRFGGEVTVLTMGPPQAKNSLREAYAMGVDKCILLSDRKFAGADTLATSNALAAALRELDYDLIIAGRQAIDGDTAQVGPQTAEHLGLPLVSYVTELDYDIDSNKILLKRVIEDGYYKMRSSLPCVITMLKDANKPRYMTVNGIWECFDKDIEVWTVDNITVDEEKLGLKGSPTRVVKSFSKGAKGAGTIHKDLDPKVASRVIIEKLREKFIV